MSVPPALRRLHHVHAAARRFFADNDLLPAPQRGQDGDVDRSSRPDAIRFVEPHLSDAWDHCSLWLP